MAKQVTYTPQIKFSPELELTLRRMNPWWGSGASMALPPFRRQLVGQIRRRLSNRLAPIVVVRGARQIGKTVSQLQVLEDLLSEGLPGNHVFRVQFDEISGLSDFKDPILRLVDYYEQVILGKTLNDTARDGNPAFLFFDEVQNLENWAPQLKALVDSSTTQVVVTGSSALRIEHGRDSLAGCITTIEAGVLSLTEIAGLRGIDLGGAFLGDNGVNELLKLDFWKCLADKGQKYSRERDAAFKFFSERGGYPIGHARPEVAWPELADQLNETVVKRVVQHDLRLGERGRKRDPALLEELFRLVCHFAGQSPPVHTIAEQAREVMGANLGDNRVRAYLKFLGETLLVRAIEPLEIRLKRRRGSPKLCLVDHALRASWLQEIVPLDPAILRLQPDLGTIAGRLAESVVGATLSAVGGLDLNHLPERRDMSEIDFVITIGVNRIPVEVKYQERLDPIRDPAALRQFIGKKINHAPFGILITRSDTHLDFDESIVALPLSSFLLLR